jgi:hypothetical protein
VSSTDQCPNFPRCDGNCPVGQCELDVDRAAAELALEDDWEPCDHVCDEDCEDYQGFWQCLHQHCFACGGCGCPGYCDDYQTYNLRPAETGGDALAAAEASDG